MSDRIKTNLEELKKSFPSLDDFSARKLLGGLIPLDHNPDPDPPPSDIGSGNPGRPPSTGSPSGGAVTAGGGDYFGDFELDWDWGNDGWGDGGWGDSDPGGDSNPGASDGGNGQNSSGNPGTGQTSPDYSDLEFINNTNPSVYEHRTYNNTSETLYGKPDHDTPYDRVIVPPGGFTDVPLDAFKVGGYVYKVTDGYGTLRVYDSFYTTMYSDEPILWIFNSPLEIMQDWLANPGNPCERTDFAPGDIQWDNIFLPP